MNIFGSNYGRPEPELHRYVELPLSAPQPRIWKCIGHAAPGLEMHYALETFGGDLDIDRESDLKVDLCNAATLLNSNGALHDGIILAQQYGARHVVRFVACDCYERNLQTKN